MTKFHYLTLGYSLFWIALAIYLFSLSHRLRRVAQMLGDLRRRLGSRENASAE